MDFPGVALVTGAASGIGRATALLYAAEGCKRIAVADRDLANLLGVQDAIRETQPETEVLTVELDVRSQSSVQALVKTVVDRFGRIDYCANCAGILRFGDSAALPIDDFEDVYQVNLRGIFYCCKAEVNAMMQQEPIFSSDSPWPARGAIVNVASQAGLTGNADLPAYVASKHGVVGLSKCDGLKYGAHGIRVNALCPGTIETPILNSIPGSSADLATKRSGGIALGRIGSPKEIAQCIIFLTSGRSSYITATTLSPHGGLQV